MKELLNSWNKLENLEYNWLKGKIDIVSFGEVIYIPTKEFFGEGYLESLIPSEDDNEDMVKLNMKAFMVYALNNMMLSNSLVLPPIDIGKENTPLIIELKKVKVEKIGTNGQPVYTKKDLHKFAASLLACYSYFIRKGKYRVVQENGKKYLRRDMSFLDPDYIPPAFIYPQKYFYNNPDTNSPKFGKREIGGSITHGAAGVREYMKNIMKEIGTNTAPTFLNLGITTKKNERRSHIGYRSLSGRRKI